MIYKLYNLIIFREGLGGFFPAKIFTKYFPELQNKFVHDYDIQAYKILNMKLDKIIELNKIKANYKSNDTVKQILLELYDKRFTILEN